LKGELPAELSLEQRISELADVIGRHRYRFSNERDLQDGIQRVLELNSIGHSREYRLTGHDIVDFLVGDVGIEVKVSGSPVQVYRQLARYAESEEIAGLILVTARTQLSPAKIILGKPVKTVKLGAFL
jgi:hypothetical protein